MISYTKAAMERAMKVQEVILRVLAKKITWWQAAEIIGQAAPYPLLPVASDQSTFRIPLLMPAIIAVSSGI